MKWENNGYLSGELLFYLHYLISCQDIVCFNRGTYYSVACVVDMMYLHVCVCFCTGYQIESFDNPADFFMDVTNGEAKSTFESLNAGKHTV